MDYQDMRRRILDATLMEVPFEGWTQAAIQRGAAAAGLSPEMAHEAFPRGVTELLEFHIATADAEMVAALQAMDLAAMRTRDRIATAIRVRLERQMANRESIRRALTLLAMPHNAPIAARTLYRTVDAIWHVAGDRSTDFNFYTKRGLLAGVYSATVLYWLNDRSEGCADTWAFLDRRIENVMQAGKKIGQASSMAANLPDPFRMLARLRAGMPRRGPRFY